MSEQYYVGTTLKFLVTIEAEGFSLADDAEKSNFDIVLRCGLKKYTCQPEDIAPADALENSFYLFIDTTKFGPGLLQMIVYTYIKDEDFVDKKRTEIAVLNLCKINQL